MICSFEEEWMEYQEKTTTTGPKFEYNQTMDIFSGENVKEILVIYVQGCGTEKAGEK